MLANSEMAGDVTKCLTVAMEQVNKWDMKAILVTSMGLRDITQEQLDELLTSI